MKNRHSKPQKRNNCQQTTSARIEPSTSPSEYTPLILSSTEISCRKVQTNRSKTPRPPHSNGNKCNKLFRYVLPFSGGLPETGPFAPVSRYPATTTTNLRSGQTETATYATEGRTTDELAQRLAELKQMQEEDVWDI